MYLQIRTMKLRKLFLKGSLSRRLWSFSSFWGIRKKFLFEGEGEKNRLFLRGGDRVDTFDQLMGSGSVTTNRATDIRGRSYIMSRGREGRGFSEKCGISNQNFTPQIITYENCTPPPPFPSLEITILWGGRNHQLLTEQSKQSSTIKNHLTRIKSAQDCVWHRSGTFTHRLLQKILSRETDFHQVKIHFRLHQKPFYFTVCQVSVVSHNAPRSSDCELWSLRCEDYLVS